MILIDSSKKHMILNGDDSRLKENIEPICFVGIGGTHECDETD
jgi:hypothetical protein